ncbi:hypothetical protein AKJ09_09158 [Labilithrix luteola]|uniref:Uncharacterized protein n=1 Tax=Labilithrix luteola TaxID=1391654 RepID=A0A0K1QAP6_9BACT|nr:hypothetical protein [Labilithrix luteola]AKV02495.1 hypothetical protein AKJ09_09158 [Labilithrix luteola]
MDVSVLLEPTLDLPRLTEILDGLGHEGRVHTIRTWGKHQQAKIFEAAKGHMKLDLDFLVPTGTDPLVEVIHDGQNTLPLFNHFQKRFTKLEGEDFPIGGYNHQTMSPVTGPGYFVVTLGEGEHEGELAIDYTKLPKHKPESWPKIRPNDGLGALVYGGMIDHLRGISSHVSIGRAYKGKAMDAWFALVRKDPS